MVKRLFDIQKVPYIELEFFKLATDKKENLNNRI